MRCPQCNHPESKVIDSRPVDEGMSIRRRRECEGCGNRFTTYERLGEYQVIVIKSDGSSEAFDRQKLMRGVLMACAKRPVTPDQIEQLIASIEKSFRTTQKTEIRSKELGEMVLTRLAKLDHVAYIRFASVYKDFKTADEFSRALKDLM